MKFHVQSHLGYRVSGPATLFTSLHCMRTAGQTVSEESFITSRHVDFEELHLGPAGNRFARIATQEAGDLSIDYSAIVETASLRVKRSELPEIGPDALPPEVIPYLFPSRYCESDALLSEVADLFPAADYEADYDRVEAMVRWIYENLRYESGSTDEQSTASSVLQTKAGVCRDFAHLGIAFCRAMTIPARYATVYAYRLEPQDFHACFEAHIGGRWCLFDATRLAPLNGLARISTGRDAADSAVASLFGEIENLTISVNVKCLDEDFQPLGWEELRNVGEAFIVL